MGSINISIKKEAYDFLKSLKERDRSFSDIILEFKERRRGTTKDLLKFVGVMKNISIDWKAKEERMRELRDSFNRRLNKK